MLGICHLSPSPNQTAIHNSWPSILQLPKWPLCSHCIRNVAFQYEKAAVDRRKSTGALRSLRHQPPSEGAARVPVLVLLCPRCCGFGRLCSVFSSSDSWGEETFWETHEAVEKGGGRICLQDTEETELRLKTTESASHLATVTSGTAQTGHRQKWWSRVWLHWDSWSEGAGSPLRMYSCKKGHLPWWIPMAACTTGFPPVPEENPGTEHGTLGSPVTWIRPTPEMPHCTWEPGESKDAKGMASSHMQIWGWLAITKGNSGHF